MSKDYHGTSSKPSLVQTDKPQGDSSTNNSKIFKKFHDERNELQPGSKGSKATNLDTTSN